MDWATWAPLYGQILDDFGFPRAADEAARDELDALLARRPPVDLFALHDALSGREAWILGPAATDDDLARIPPEAPLLVADAAAHLVADVRAPLALVTDLDGDLDAQARLSRALVPVFVHAHGDNRHALARHVPRLPGPLVGTTQAEPRGRVRGFGGFTDGDRAGCIAVSLGATGLRLVGFDFENPAPKDGRDPETKRRKLAWAERILDGLGVPVQRVSSSIQPK